MQPDWRNGEFGRENVGRWPQLEVPGKNGILIVLMTLAWWSESLPSLDDLSWSTAVNDVAWVFSNMVLNVDETADDASVIASDDY